MKNIINVRDSRRCRGEAGGVVSIIILLAFVLSLSAAVNSYARIDTGSGIISFCMLNVCGGQGTEMTGSSHTPFLNTDMCQSIVPEFAGFSEVLKNNIKPISLAFQEDRPPRV